MENANAVAITAQVYRIAKRLSTKQNGMTLSQPTKDEQGILITNTQQQLKAWPDFLERNFAARENELVVDLQSQTEEYMLKTSNWKKSSQL